MFCGKKKKKNNEGNAFCRKCGVPFLQSVGSKQDKEPEIKRKAEENPAVLKKRHIVTICIVTVLFIAVLVVGGGVVWMNSGTRQVDRQLSLGEKYLSELSYDEAIVAFNKVIEIEPKNVDAYIGLADAYIGMGDTAKAVEVLGNGLGVTGSERVKTKLIDLQEYTTGNTVGNIVNWGFAAKQGNWIYFCKPEDSFNIYKVKEDGTNPKKLNDHMSVNINVIGDWVYYLAQSEDSYGGILYRMRTDGTEQTMLNNDESLFINVVGNWIYYTNISDGNKLYKIRTDGTDRTKLTDDESWDVNVVDDWIYYCDNETSGKIYRIKIDGTQRSQIIDDASCYINVVDDWVYYSNNDDKGRIYRIKTDGTHRTKLDDDMGGDYICINVYNDWVYYNGFGFAGFGIDGIYKIRTDGTDKTILNEDAYATFINVIGDWIYYILFDESGSDIGLYKIRTDGTGRQLVE